MHVWTGHLCVHAARSGGEHMAFHIRHSVGRHGRRLHHNRKNRTNDRRTRQQIKMTHPRHRLSLRRVAPQLNLASQLHGLRVRRHLELLAQVWKEKRREHEISFLALEIQRGNIAMNTPWKHGMKASKFDPEIAKRSDPKWNQRRDQRRMDR